MRVIIFFVRLSGICVYFKRSGFPPRGKIQISKKVNFFTFCITPLLIRLSMISHHLSRKTRPDYLHNVLRLVFILI